MDWNLRPTWAQGVAGSNPAAPTIFRVCCATIVQRRAPVSVEDPWVRVGELIRRLEQDGWYAVRQTGSHRVYRHHELSGLRRVPVHVGKELATYIKSAPSSFASTP